MTSNFYFLLFHTNIFYIFYMSTHYSLVILLDFCNSCISTYYIHLFFFNFFLPSMAMLLNEPNSFCLYCCSVTVVCIPPLFVPPLQPNRPPSLVSNLLLVFNVILIKIPMAYFTDLEQIVQNFIWNLKKP